MSLRRLMFRCFLPLLLCGALALGGCEKRLPARAEKTRAEEGVTTYEVRGVLHEKDAAGRKAVIAHETIAGYMEAMTMEFAVRDPAELAAVAPGDEIGFRLSVTASESWIDRVRPTGKKSPVTRRAAADVFAPRTAPPDVKLIAADGKAIALADFRGRAVAITFIFTRCPLPDFCPRMSGHFAEAQRLLAAGDKWHLLSITIDPEYDTPERLAAYAQRYEADPARWTFATGEPAEIARLSEFFGVKIAQPGELPDHNLRTAVIDPAGRVRKVFVGNEWNPGELVEELKRAIAAEP